MNQCVFVKAKRMWDGWLGQDLMRHLVTGLGGGW